MSPVAWYVFLLLPAVFNNSSHLDEQNESFTFKKLCLSWACHNYQATVYSGFCSDNDQQAKTSCCSFKTRIIALLKYEEILWISPSAKICGSGIKYLSKTRRRKSVILKKPGETMETNLKSWNGFLWLFKDRRIQGAVLFVSWMSGFLPSRMLFLHSRTFDYVSKSCFKWWALYLLLKVLSLA